MSSEYDIKTLVQYLSAIALLLFYLVYMPFTYLSSEALGMNYIVLWVYYFALVLGVLFPLYYAIGKENYAWYCLGLGITVSGIIWLLLGPATVEETASAALTLILGVIYFLAQLLEGRVANWDPVKNIFHIIKGLLMVLACAFYANWDMEAFIAPQSWNHIMPHFIFIGGGLAVAFGIVLLAYGLFNLLSLYLVDRVKAFFGDTAKVFYMLMVIVWLLGIVYNINTYYTVYPWGAVSFPVSIQFFVNFFLIAISDLGAILMIILFIYAMGKIATKYQEQ
ncbi:hypothetical protein EU545_04470 [Candidatus Thorarchaeota archaeon]|nr:MAG: hypothetical protein EU545_04470 [Candidatus Thorarchaeota archaeon]